MSRLSLKGRDKLLAGYTIVEITIFLAVSGALLVAIGSVLSGRQDRVRFTQAVDRLELSLQDVFNDTATGYFPSNSDFSCTSNQSNKKVTLSSVDEDQGSNTDCIFVGKLIHFYSQDTNGDFNPNLFSIYTLVGSRYADDIFDGDIVALGSTFNNPGIVEREIIGANIYVQREDNPSYPSSYPKYIYGVRDVTTGDRYHSLVITSAFQASGTEPTSTNASKVKLYGYSAWANSHNGSPGRGVLKNLTNPGSFAEIDEAVVLCLQQDGLTEGRIAALRISKQLTIERFIDNQPDICTS